MKRAKKQRHVFEVQPVKGFRKGWVVRVNSLDIKLWYSTKAEAQRVAKTKARSLWVGKGVLTQVLIHKIEGTKYQKERTYGEDPVKSKG